MCSQCTKSRMKEPGANGSREGEAAGVRRMRLFCQQLEFLVLYDQKLDGLIYDIPF